MNEYGKIKKSIMSEVAEEIRKAAGLTRELKPHEMVYWLKRIICLPQGCASSDLKLNTLDISCTVSGILPEIHRGTASSVLNLSTLNFTSTAVGILQEE